MMQSLPFIYVLLFLATVACVIPTSFAGVDIKRKVTGGPSSKPHTKCFNHESIEKGDIVVMNFNASIDESSPSGTPGAFVTSSSEHSKTGGPLAVLVASPDLKDGWDLALLGLCEKDTATLIVPPKYVHGEAFKGKNIPDDAIIRIDVEIVDILIDVSDSDSEDFSESDSDDGDEL